MACVAGVPGRGAERTAHLIYLVLVVINLEPCTLTLRGQTMHGSCINPTLEGLKVGIRPASWRGTHIKGKGKGREG